MIVSNFYETKFLKRFLRAPNIYVKIEMYRSAVVTLP